jgi:polysaccharide biosynthesis/export protein ExoF
MLVGRAPTRPPAAILDPFGRIERLSNSPKLRRTAWCALLLIPFVIGHPTDLARADDLSTKQAPLGAKSESTIRIGDKIKLSFYEILDSDEAKWRGPNGRAATAPREFHERAELTGEYPVQEDGSITVPLLGTFAVADQERATLTNVLTPALEQLVGRKGYVNVLAIERQPIYVVGPVKNPGCFKYEPGLTALHAVALAGGMRRTDAESWQSIESRRELVTLEKSLDKVKRLVARTVVLQAERGDGDETSSVKELVNLVGQKDSKLLVDQEASQRRISELDRAVQGAALSGEVNNYRSEVAARAGRIVPFDDNIKLRTERVKGLQQLVEKNIATRAPLVQAQSELTDAQDRRQQALIEVEATREKLRQSEQALAKHNLQTRLAIEQAVAAAERDGADAVADTEGSLNVLRSFSAEQKASNGDGSVSFEIVRHSSSGAKVIQVSETTLLEPGDLLRVSTITVDQVN